MTASVNPGAKHTSKLTKLLRSHARKSPYRYLFNIRLFQSDGRNLPTSAQSVHVRFGSACTPAYEDYEPNGADDLGVMPEEPSREERWYQSKFI
jgi:hypothetical protein